MKEHDSEAVSIPELIKKVTQHAQTRLDYAQLTLVEKISKAYARHISDGLMVRIFCMGALFVGLAASAWLGKYFDDYAKGFGVVALFFFALFALYIILRKTVINPKLTDKVIHSLYAEEENDDDDEEA